MPSTRDFMSSSMRRTSACSMMGTRGAVGSFQCAMFAPCLRSFAYSTALRNAVDATPRPWMPTPMRALFISLNICGMPWFSFASPPTGQPRQVPASPKLRTHVADALIPILCSMFASVTSLVPVSLPSSSVALRGTMKSVRPLVPAGAPSTRASTRWMMFSARSWSPAEMKIFVPRIV